MKAIIITGAVIGVGAVGYMTYKAMQLQRLNKELVINTTASLARKGLGLLIKVNVKMQNPTGQGLSIRHPFVSIYTDRTSQKARTPWLNSDSKPTEYRLKAYETLSFDIEFPITLFQLSAVKQFYDQYLQQGKVSIIVETITTLNNVVPYTKEDVITLGNTQSVSGLGMVAQGKRPLKDGRQYEECFGKIAGKERVLYDHIAGESTIEAILQCRPQYAYQTAHLAKKLVGKTQAQTLSNIWHFVYQHIQYTPDTEGSEELHTPNRIWHKRKHGVDCDDYSFLISCILSNLGITHALRMTAYQKGWQHVYVIVPKSNDFSDYYTLDCVTDYFNYEVPFSRKQDYQIHLSKDLKGLSTNQQVWAYEEKPLCCMA